MVDSGTGGTGRSGPHGQTVLVTGGNRGIGLEVVRSVLEQPGGGHRVYLGCRDLPAGRLLAAGLADAHGQRVEAIHLDVTCACSVAAAFEQVSRGEWGLDALVNNAGVLLDGDGAPYSSAVAAETVHVNFRALVGVTETFLPLLLQSPGGGQVLSTSSGAATRAMSMLDEERRQNLTSVSLTLPCLEEQLAEMLEAMRSPNCAYRAIPTPAYSVSKLAVNCYTQVLAREQPTLRVNACSPGFCNTRMCANYSGARQPKDPALGASVFHKVLFGALGESRTGCFFKEASVAGTPVEKAMSALEPWVARQQ